MLELTIRLIVSLAIVIGLLLVLAKFGARKFRGANGALVHVVHRQPLSRTSAVAVVTVGSRVLVLGTTEHQVSVLAELDPEELDLEDLVAEADFETVHGLAQPVPPVQQVQPVTVGALGSLLRGRGTEGTTTATRGSHRAAPTNRISPATDSGALAGSVLSLHTWRQAFSAARRAS